MIYKPKSNVPVWNGGPLHACLEMGGSQLYHGLKPYPPNPLLSIQRKALDLSLLLTPPPPISCLLSSTDEPNALN